VGGVFSLQYTTGFSYKLTLNVYRDCVNSTTPFDNPATVGIFDLETNVLMETYQLNLASSSILPYVGYNCLNALPSGCTDVGIYTRNITLNPSKFNNNKGYYFSYQRCCRNDIINNIQQPGDAGIAIYMEIPSPKKLINSTPVMNANPNALFCQDKLTVYDFEFTDADGDQLVYSMVNPLNGNLDKNNPIRNFATAGPYSEISWIGGYTTQQQIIGSPSLNINNNTGVISVSPLATGIFVIAIKVEEYRAGVKIGETRLELQVTVSQCPQPKPQLLVKDESGNIIGNFITIKAPDKKCITIEVTDPADSLFLTITNTSVDTNIFLKPTFTKSINGIKKVNGTICWEASCILNSKTTQNFKVIARDNGCPKFASIELNLIVNAIPMPTANPTDLVCMTLIDNKTTILYWGDSTGNVPYFTKYYLYRGINNSNFILLDSIENKSIRSYQDTNTPNYSSINYQYFMRSVNECGYIGPSSDTLGTFEQLKSLPDQQKIITVSVENNSSIKLSWPKSNEKDFARYSVYKKEASATTYKLIHETNSIIDTSYNDNETDVSKKSYCYHVIMKDTCDNYGPMGKEACSILLTGNSIPFANNLAWNQYSFWENGTAFYELIALGDQSISANKTIVSANDSVFIDENLDILSGQFKYTVVANQKENSQGKFGTESDKYTNSTIYSKSNEIILSQKALLHIPNAFTPNGDGNNDDWNIRDVFVQSYYLEVYNKWGQLIFKTSDKRNKWNGQSFSGETVISDTYIFIISYTDYYGKVLTRNGNVTVLK
jgi:gliding motility-associated-like protein